MNKEYRIRIDSESNPYHNIIRIQVKCLIGWINIWERYYNPVDEEYAQQCAEELIESLNAKI